MHILGAIGLAILTVNLILYFFKFRGNTNTYKIFVVYLLTIGIIDLWTYIYALYGLNNHFLSSLYLFFKFLLLSCFFYALFQRVNEQRRKMVKYITLIILVGLAVQYGFDPTLFYTFNPIGFVVTGAALIIFSIFYLYELLSKKLPFQFVVVGLFLYLTSSTLIFASGVFIMTFGEINLLVWKMNAVLFILYQLLILWEWKQSFFQKSVNQHG